MYEMEKTPTLVSIESVADTKETIFHWEVEFFSSTR
jgi:hypothetical protein